MQILLRCSQRSKDFHKSFALRRRTSFPLTKFAMRSHVATLSTRIRSEERKLQMQICSLFLVKETWGIPLGASPSCKLKIKSGGGSLDASFGLLLCCIYNSMCSQVPCDCVEVDGEVSAHQRASA